MQGTMRRTIQKMLQKTIQGIRQKTGQGINSRLTIALLVFCCIFGWHSGISLAAGAIDTSASVSVTLEYYQEKQPVAGVPFDLYCIADADAYGEYTLTQTFVNYPVRVDGLSAEAWKSLAETLCTYIDRDKVPPLCSGNTDAQGKLQFPEQNTLQNGASLKPGLYLVRGRELNRDGYIYTTEPFLVQLPSQDKETNTWVYAVTAQPKHTRTQIPPQVPEDDTVERKVLKVWKNDNDKVRPTQITVQLLWDGAVYDTVTLCKDNNWRYTWKELPEYRADGSRIVWQVTEKDLKNYTVLVTQEGITFVVTNTYSPGDGSDKTPPGPGGKLPQTGVLWWPVPVLAGSGILLLFGSSLLKRKDRHEKGL